MTRNARAGVCPGSHRTSFNAPTAGSQWRDRLDPTKLELARSRKIGAGVALCSADHAAYTKLFHPIHEDRLLRRLAMFWDEVEKASVGPTDLPEGSIEQRIAEAAAKGTLIHGGASPGASLTRLSWRTLTERVGLPFVPTLSSWSFTRCFAGRSWPRALIGPEEGNLDATDRDALASVLAPYTGQQACLFHVELLATVDWGNTPSEGMTFEGALSEVSLFPDQVPGVRLTPTYWFPRDRSWLVRTDYDLTFTLIAGPQSLADDLLNHTTLECVRVDPDMSVGKDADVLGAPSCDG